MVVNMTELVPQVVEDELFLLLKPSLPGRLPRLLCQHWLLHLIYCFVPVDSHNIPGEKDFSLSLFEKGFASVSSFFLSFCRKSIDLVLRSPLGFTASVDLLEWSEGPDMPLQHYASCRSCGNIVILGNEACSMWLCHKPA